jgi:hypothetical protein
MPRPASVTCLLILPSEASRSSTDPRQHRSPPHDRVRRARGLPRSPSPHRRQHQEDHPDPQAATHRHHHPRHPADHRATTHPRHGPSHPRQHRRGWSPNRYNSGRGGRASGTGRRRSSPKMEVLPHLEYLDVHDATSVGFDRPDLTLFCRLDELGLEVAGQRLDPDRAVLACRVNDPDDWCRRCGCQGLARETRGLPAGARSGGDEPACTSLCAATAVPAAGVCGVKTPAGPRNRGRRRPGAALGGPASAQVSGGTSPTSTPR